MVLGLERLVVRKGSEENLGKNYNLAYTNSSVNARE